MGIVVDSSSDLPRTALEERGMESAPIVVILDGQEVEVGPELEVARFARRLAATPLERVSTSGVNVEAWSAAVERLRRQGAGAVLLLALASRLSVTHRSALAAAELAEPFPVRVVDAGTASCGLAALALGAARWAAAGASLERLERWTAEATGRTRTVVASTETRLLRHIGRLDAGEGEGRGGDPEKARYVLLEIGQRIRPVGVARDEAEAAERMVELLRPSWVEGAPEPGGWQLVAAHAGNRPAADRLERLLDREPGLAGRSDLFRIDGAPILALLSRSLDGFGLGLAPRPELPAGGPGV
ncbi:MAG: DegV family protein [Bacillota bacterium]|nr:DegV family protein [Bacillota bacterium]